MFRVFLLFLKRLYSLLVRIAELRFASHLKGFFIFLIVGMFAAFLSQTGIAQTEKDIVEIAGSFRTSDVGESVADFKKNFPRPITDKRVKDQAFRKINKEFGHLRIQNKRLETRLRSLFSPVLELYKREDIYKFFIVRHRTPFILIQSQYVLVITTGLLQEVQSDDELLGFVAHEVGHDYFMKYSLYAEPLYVKVKLTKSDTALHRNVANLLAIIELQCDAFSAITMAYLGYQPSAFTLAAQRMSEKFPVDPESYHPSTSMRVKVTRGVFSNLPESPKKQVISKELKAVRKMLKTES